MPTNQEWLHKLANESPDELKAWFDAEHVDETACVTKTTDLLDGVGVYSREKLESEVRTIAAINEDDEKGRKLFEDMIINMLDRQAEITERQYEERVANIEHQIGAIKAANDDYRAEVDRLQRRNDELRTSYDKLKRERDNLADDLLTCNREREQLRNHLGIALDHAHDICSLVDINGNVLDVGE